MRPGSAEFERANGRVKQLHPEAFCVYVEGASKDMRCQVRIQETLLFGGEDGGIEHVAYGLIGAGPTWPLAMEQAWNWRADPNRKVLLKDRLPGDAP